MYIYIHIILYIIYYIYYILHIYIYINNIYIYVLGFVFRKYKTWSHFLSGSGFVGLSLQKSPSFGTAQVTGGSLCTLQEDHQSRRGWPSFGPALAVKFWRGVSRRQAMPGFRWERKRSTRGAGRETCWDFKNVWEIHVSQLKFPKKTSQKKTSPKTIPNYPKTQLFWSQQQVPGSFLRGQSNGSFQVWKRSGASPVHLDFEAMNRHEDQIIKTILIVKTMWKTGVSRCFKLITFYDFP